MFDDEGFINILDERDIDYHQSSLNLADGGDHGGGL